MASESTRDLTTIMKRPYSIKSRAFGDLGYTAVFVFRHVSKYFDGRYGPVRCAGAGQTHLKLELRLSGQVRKRAIAAIVWVAEAVDAMAHAMRYRQQQAVVRHFVVAERTSHFHSQAVANQHKWNVV